MIGYIYFQTCQTDIVRENGFKYFFQLVEDIRLPVSIKIVLILFFLLFPFL